MKRAELPGEPPVEITLRRSARARRFSLRVSGLDGRVTLTLPERGNLGEALAFARGREDWIRQVLAKQEVPVDVTHGAVLPYEGREMTVTATALSACRAAEDALLAPADPALVALRVKTFLKAAARRRLLAASEQHAGRLGRGIGRITLRDPRSRWGSCSARGDLMYSWRLVMAPPEVLDYVAAHEVAHLAQMNHSPAFWAVVAELCPDYRAHRGWLRREGATLHRYRFGN
jgi:predicted metal-dependent hydrolase